ncbi:MAG: hypothetical protein SGARI_002381, partial [Bacillariaceae sp.]
MFGVALADPAVSSPSTASRDASENLLDAESDAKSESESDDDTIDPDEPIDIFAKYLPRGGRRRGANIRLHDDDEVEHDISFSQQA